MNDDSQSLPDDDIDEFERLNHEKHPWLLVEFWQFLKENKKWWLVPLLIALGVYAAFLIVSISNGPVFIYKFF